MWENTNQENSEYDHFSSNVYHMRKCFTKHPYRNFQLEEGSEKCKPTQYIFSLKYHENDC